MGITRKPSTTVEIGYHWSNGSRAGVLVQTPGVKPHIRAEIGTKALDTHARLADLIEFHEVIGLMIEDLRAAESEQDR